MKSPLPAAHPGVTRVLEFYDALGRRDYRALQRLVSLDVRLHLAGSSALAGTYRGVGEVIALGAKLEYRLVPEASELNEIDARGDRVRAVVTVRVRAPRAEPIPVRLIETFALDGDGRLSEAWIQGEDQAAVDEVLGR
jgi:hypothetical protein